MWKEVLFRDIKTKTLTGIEIKQSSDSESQKNLKPNKKNSTFIHNIMTFYHKNKQKKTKIGQQLEW